MNLQGCEASDAKTLQSQNSQNAKIRILLNALRVVHGRLVDSMCNPYSVTKGQAAIIA
jgi:hypothetical protein